MKWILFFLLFCTLITPVFAEEFNAGIVQGLWYSQEPLFANKAVRIYVAVRNGTGSDLTGEVSFFDNNTRIGSTDVSALNGRIIESWSDWTPTYGDHTISASLSQTKLSSVGTRAEKVTIGGAVAEDTFFIDYDTDSDGIGNKTDIDDDGDGISDAEEKKNGTDPLIFDDPAQESSYLTKESESKKTTDAQDTTVNRSNGAIEGIEQYLTPSHADTVLGNITTIIHNSKEKLDAYRHSRAVENGKATPTLEDIQVNKDGFGEITRTTDTPQKTKEKSRLQKPTGFLGSVFTFIGTITSIIYTGILTGISWALGYPMLMQLLLLFGILYILYKTAKKLGGRPQ